VKRIGEQNCDLPLQELDILGSYTPDLLPKIFQKTPALKRLRILHSETSQHDVHFDDLLPALDKLCCPLFLLRSLVPGRPISSIDITTSIMLTEILDIPPLFKKSTGKIRSLCVPTPVYLMNPFWAYFPHLESLRLQCEADYQQAYQCPLNELSLKQSLSAISDTCRRNLLIQELHIDLVVGCMDPFFDLDLQNKIISTIFSPRFPYLRRMSISDYVVWNKVQQDDVWKPSLHRISLIGVAKRLNSGEVNPVDYDGFFEQILSTAEEFW